MAFWHITIPTRRNWKLKKEGNYKCDFQDLSFITLPLRFSSTCIQHRSYIQYAIGAAYKILGLKNNANLIEVKAAYHQLALKWFVFFQALHHRKDNEILQIKKITTMHIIANVDTVYPCILRYFVNDNIMYKKIMVT